ncbi:oligoendopeptidase F [Planctomycetota bacterium]
MTENATDNVKKLPERSEVAAADTWDLATLYPSDDAWQSDLEKAKEAVPKYEPFKGQLASVDKLGELLDFDSEVDHVLERLGCYAYLRSTEDQKSDAAQRMVAQFQNVASRAAEASSFIRPELLLIPADEMDTMIADPKLDLYRLSLQRLLRYRDYTLTNKEEELLAMQSEMAGAIGKAFRQLLDADMKFGTIENEKGEQVELGHATFSQLLICPDRNVRAKAFTQYYEEMEAHENTLAATLKGSIDKDVYYARARGYDSALSKALYPDNVPQKVYDQLIDTVSEHLPAVHDYYDLRRRKMGIDDIHFYDTYVPILSDLETNRTWEEATELIMNALQPLGDEYCSVLEKGLRGRWCDRYPNQGKSSGAFSYGTFDGDPYILMNYQPTVLRDVFTLAHEAGHSMHSHYSAKHQPYEYYNYTIFVAEVASTFNESLLNNYMLENAADDKERAYLINHEIDDIRATIVRQTMFAEFEKITHGMAEAGEPLTVQSFKDTYRKLLEKYLGPNFEIDEQLSLECMRIPHFYRAFYVYKYATGLSAAIALSQRVLHGGQAELDAYLGFLQGGCSKDPLDLLRDAGVDMESPEPVATALQHLHRRVKELNALL